MSDYALEIDTRAEREARSAFLWYLERDEGVAVRFEAVFRQALAKLAASPLRFPAHIHGTRRALVGRFPYLVVFAVRGSTVRVLAVAHMKQRPGYWRDR